MIWVCVKDDLDPAQNGPSFRVPFKPSWIFQVLFFHIKSGDDPFFRGLSEKAKEAEKGIRGPSQDVCAVAVCNKAASRRLRARTWKRGVKADARFKA